MTSLNMQSPFGSECSTATLTPMPRLPGLRSGMYGFKLPDGSLQRKSIFWSVSTIYYSRLMEIVIERYVQKVQRGFVGTRQVNRPQRGPREVGQLPGDR